MNNLINPILRPPLEVVIKKWGSETIIDNNAEYCGKILKFKQGASFSNHYHLKKRETFHIYSGIIEFQYFDLATAELFTVIAKAGDCIEIPRGCPHKIRAMKESVVFEVSTHHEDSDSYRIGKGDSQLK